MNIRRTTMSGRRFLVFLAALLTFALVAASCGSDDDGSAAEPVADAEGEGIEESEAEEAEEPEAEEAEEPEAEEAEDANDVLSRAFDALGGAEVLSSTSNLQIEAIGETRVPFEGFDPGEAVSANTYSRSYSIDVEQDLIRVDITRKPLFEAFQFFPEESFTIVANDRVGHLSDPALFTFPGDLATQNVTALWRQQILFNPQLLLAAAAENPEIVSVGEITELDGRTHRILTIDNDVAPIHLFMDNRTALISKLVTTENNPLVRDVEVEVHYRDWQEDEDMPYPAEVEVVVDGLSLWEESRTAFSTPDELPSGVFDNLALADPTAFDPALASTGSKASTSFSPSSPPASPSPQISPS